MKANDIIDYEADVLPDENVCREWFRAQREAHGVVCPRCGSREHYWKSQKWMYQCKSCGYRQSLRANTLMHASKLPYRYWYAAAYLLEREGDRLSITQLQRMLRHHRYQAIWELVNKLRPMVVRRADGQATCQLDAKFFM